MESGQLYNILFLCNAQVNCALGASLQTATHAPVMQRKCIWDQRTSSLEAGTAPGQPEQNQECKSSQWGGWVMRGMG